MPSRDQGFCSRWWDIWGRGCRDREGELSFHFVQVMSTDDEDGEGEKGGLGELRDDHLEDLDEVEDDVEEEFVQ